MKKSSTLGRYEGERDNEPAVNRNI